MNLPSRAQMVGMAERLQSIEGQLNEIKAMLHQMHHNSLSPESGVWHASGRRAPSVRRRRESKNERCPPALDLASHPGADPVRGAARDPAQHQGRRIYRLLGSVARLDAEGHSCMSAAP